MMEAGGIYQAEGSSCNLRVTGATRRGAVVWDLEIGTHAQA